METSGNQHLATGNAFHFDIVKVAGIEIETAADTEAETDTDTNTEIRVPIWHASQVSGKIVNHFDRLLGALRLLKWCHPGPPEHQPVQPSPCVMPIIMDASELGT